MTDRFNSLRVHRNFLYVVLFVLLFAACGMMLIRTIHALGPVAYVFMLALATLAFFFVSILNLFTPYLRIDDDRIVISHDLLRKDVLFFYDLTRIDFEEENAICIYHINGLTRVVYSKFNAFDKEKVLAFFRELAMEAPSLREA
ncbi:MAG TPA: hypothetical protein VGO45_12080 [Bacteroidia bacterium]|nr:hypothetical protein [Bacteroidia bacterium]